MSASIAATKIPAYPRPLPIATMLPFDNNSKFQVIVDMPADTPVEQTAAVLYELGSYLATVLTLVAIPILCSVAYRYRLTAITGKAEVMTPKPFALTDASLPAAQ